MHSAGNMVKIGEIVGRSILFQQKKEIYSEDQFNITFRLYGYCPRFSLNQRIICYNFSSFNNEILVVYIPVPRQLSINYFQFTNESNNTFKLKTFKLGFFL